jgi:RND family efflux transporter MFP subunit
MFSVLAAAALLAACAEEPTPKPPPLVPVMRVADAGELTTTPFPGRAKAGQEVNMSFRVSGSLIEFPVDVGDEVEAGQLLAQLDPKDYISALGTVNGQLDRARAAAAKAEADYGRIMNVFREDPGATSQTAVDLTKAARDSARAEVRSLTSAVASAQDQLNYTSLQAPFSGVVVSTYLENFETVVAKQPILRLLDPTSIEFVISVPENLIGYAPLVEAVAISFDALPGVDISARVKEVGREASQATRTYPVTLVMQQPEGAEILPGMAGSAVVSARLPDDARQAGIEIPAPAVFSRDDPSKSYVWVVDESNSTLKSREVTAGRLGQRGILIQSGLKAGELVVVRGANSVSEGQQVRIVDFSAKGGAS